MTSSYIPNPKATLREIEGAIDKGLSELRARMITDTANASANTNWEAAEGVVCPECGVKLIEKGRRSGFY